MSRRLLNAKVESVARDATVDEKLGLIYRTRLSLKENSLMVDGKLTPLLPGMAVTAEISTGSGGSSSSSSRRCSGQSRRV